MEIKAQEFLKVKVDFDLETKTQVIEVYNVLEAHHDHVLMKLVRVDREPIEQCGHCGLWHGPTAKLDPDGNVVGAELV